MQELKDLNIIILTFNEELHIRRALESAFRVADRVLIIDSYSTDDTVAIARDMGALVLQNQFINYAVQFQWAMERPEINSTWVMRMDADEFLTNALVHEINERLPAMDSDIYGIFLKRRVHFMGKWIRYGGYYPIKLLRIWRNGYARIEQLWMDEHMTLLKGKSIVFNNDFIDDNLNSLTWWTEKHNQYATREAIDVLNRKFNFNIISKNGVLNNQAGRKRWYKNNVYLRLPLFLRSFLYFNYRYWIQLGFLDGRKGLVWHFLQAFWYRFLVDAKILQIQWWAMKEKKEVTTILSEKYKVKNL